MVEEWRFAESATVQACVCAKGFLYYGFPLSKNDLLKDEECTAVTSSH